METIRSKDNPTVRLYTKLSNSRKDRKRLNLFVLEGYRIVTDALKEGAPIKQVLVSEGAYERYRGDLAELGVENPLTVSDELADRMASTESTQGVFAICEAPENRPLDVDPHGKYIVLHQVQDPGNVGMIVRTADALGLDGVVLSQTCDLYSPKTMRSTMGSAFRVRHYVCDSIESVLESFREHGVRTYSAVVDSPNDVRKEDFTGGTAVVVGNEGNGLPKEVSDLCDRDVTIKMHGNVNSLNVAMASGIIMWKMSNER